MEVAGYSIDFKETFHPASFFLFDIINDPFHFLLVIHIVISVYLSFGDCYFLQIVMDIHQMHF